MPANAINASGHLEQIQEEEDDDFTVKMKDQTNRILNSTPLIEYFLTLGLSEDQIS